MRRHWRAAVLGLLLALCMAGASAHKPSDSYLTLVVNGKQVSGQWDIALRDLDMAIALDADGNGELTWDEVRARHPAIAAYALSRLRIAVSDEGGAATACPLAVTRHQLDEHSDGTYAVLTLNATCPVDVDILDVDYNLLFDIDPQHKGLLRLEHGAVNSTAIFTPDNAHQGLRVVGASRWRQFVDYVKHGVWHIWIGFDHILFLLSLLLPAVLVRREGRWHARATLRGAAVEVLKIVTAFTLAHSITLTLATLGVVTLPSRIVESAIALSVVVAALNNIWPVITRRLALLAFAFGLIHGFGFASVLLDLGLPPSSLLLSLVGFNVGVEVGQLAIVTAFLPLAFLARPTALYRKAIMVGGSALITVIASIWLLERALDFKLIS
jgi:hypothetical protein